MAKTKVSEWDSNASGNTDINGININEGCPPSTLNNMGRELMSQIKNLVDGSSGDNLTNSGTLTTSGTLAVTGALAVTGSLTLDGASGTSGQYLASAGTGTPTWATFPTAFVSGMIMLWSGSEASIPAGWLLCNGASSTPDLRNKFVVGASAGTGDTTYPGLSVGATGGSADAVVVSHTHGITDPGHTHSANSQNTPSYGQPQGGVRQGSGVTGSAFTGISINTAGVSGVNANLPPYYALCYIMKS